VATARERSPFRAFTHQVAGIIFFSFFQHVTHRRLSLSPSTFFGFELVLSVREIALIGCSGQ